MGYVCLITKSVHNFFIVSDDFKPLLKQNQNTLHLISENSMPLTKYFGYFLIMECERRFVLLIWHHLFTELRKFLVYYTKSDLNLVL